MSVVVDLASRRPVPAAVKPSEPSLDDVIRSLRLGCSAELAQHIGRMEARFAAVEARLAAIEARLVPSDPVPQAGTLSHLS